MIKIFYHEPAVYRNDKVLKWAAHISAVLFLSSLLLR